MKGVLLLCDVSVKLSQQGLHDCAANWVQAALMSLKSHMVAEKFYHCLVRRELMTWLVVQHYS